jgi:hypothetical protein
MKLVYACGLQDRMLVSFFPNSASQIKILFWL